MNRRFLAAPALGVVLVAASVTACGPSGGSGASVPSIFTPDPSISAQASAAKATGQQILLNCEPKGETVTQWEVAFGFHPKATFAALDQCENVPAAQRQALVVCVVGAVKAEAAASGPKSSKEADFVNRAGLCVQTAQGVTPSASPSPSASRS